MRLVSTHPSQWDVKFAGKWDSALKENSALRAHVARAASTDLAHREGQYVIPFSLGHADILRQHQGSFIDTATYCRRFPCRNPDARGFDAQTTEMSPNWQQCQRRHHRMRIQHLGGISPELLLGQELLFELVQSLRYVVPGSACEEHADDLSQLVTGTSRIQLLHDAAIPTFQATPVPFQSMPRFAKFLHQPFDRKLHRYHFQFLHRSDFVEFARLLTFDPHVGLHQGQPLRNACANLVAFVRLSVHGSGQATDVSTPRRPQRLTENLQACDGIRFSFA